MIRNKTMDVMLALGIISVVMGHNYQPSTFLLPAYTFQIALFFFVSGYFFSAKDTLKEKALWLKNKFIHLLVPYFLANLFFAALTYFLLTRGISLGQSPTIYNFFVMPFLAGDQYYLFLAAWFVPQLFLIHLVAQTLIVKNKTIYVVIFWLLILGATIFSLNHISPSSASWQILLTRTAFGLTFYLLGKLLKISEGNLSKYLIRPEAFILIYTTYVLIGEFFGSFNYSLVYGDFSNNAIVTLVGTLAAILMVYIISSYLALGLKDNSLLLKIGQHTYVIMLGHLLVFFLINYTFYRLALISRADLSHVFFSYQVTKTWLIYVFLGISLPLSLSLIYEKFKKAKT
jgi:fucose 4-O-acetylase-like acetyltransferase